MMSGPPARILLVDSDPKRTKLVAQVLTRVVAKPETRAALGDLTADNSYDLLIVNFDSLSTAERTEFLSRNGDGALSHRTLLMAAGHNRDELAGLFRARALTNLVATSDEVAVDELLVTVQKILRKDIFGMEKYFVWGIASRAFLVRSSNEKDKLLDTITEYTEQIGIPARLSNLFRNVADEFVSNAIYNAPVDATGKPRFLNVDRTQAVTLDAQEQIEIKVCCDGRRLGISTVDPFGSLSPTTVLDYLAKCFRKSDDQVDQRSGGAGLGFYQILDSLSHLVVNISPGKSTEMIGLIDVRGSYKDFVSSGKSFNIFIA